MYNFKNDYSQIAHIKILENMSKYALEDNNGYGLDNHSLNAKRLIKEKLENDNVDIHFLVGGTIANKVVIDHILRPYEAVIACDSGHINVHETGAIESSGHKILTVKNKLGKITKEGILEVLRVHTDEHMVKPKMVYISNSTEYGTVYYKDELEELYNVCKENDLYLFIDGARLGVALTSFLNDVEFKDLPNLCDVFYIGGTKNGAMLGEAVVLCNEKIKDDFRFSIKRNGGMYSKGFVAGIQFETLFTDDLYFELANHANDCANLLRMGLVDLEVPLEIVAYTNQIFPIFKKEVVEALKEICLFEVWEDRKEELVIRFVTSFATKEEDICDFLTTLASILSENQ